MALRPPNSGGASKVKTATNAGFRDNTTVCGKREEVAVRPDVKAFFDDTTNTVSYVVRDPQSQSCAVVDPVLDYDPNSGRIHRESADKIVDFVLARRLRVEWILETHVHADHLTAAPHLKARIGGRIAIGARIVAVQKVVGELFNAGPDFATDGRPFDQLFRD